MDFALAAFAVPILGGFLAVTPASPADDLARGVAMVKDGDFENAVTPLSVAIQALTPELSRRQDLARAYLYLGVAYLELGQELEARGKFREVLRNDPKLRPSPREFSAQVQRVFEAERLAAEPRKKRNLLPFVLVLGGGAASAGVAVAASGGADPPPSSIAATTAPTTSPSGGGGTTSTTTTLAGGPGATTTTTSTLPSSSTTTTTSTSTTTTTLPPACQYSLSPDREFQFGGGNGVCNVNVSPASCAWSVEVVGTNPGWLSLNGPTSGTGDGAVSYTVAPLQLLGSRTASIRATQDPGAGCVITQQGLLGLRRASLLWQSRLELPGGSGQIVVNGSELVFQATGLLAHGVPARDGLNRVEALVVDADGQPGLWRFDLLDGHEPGSLQVIAGRATSVTRDGVAFAVSGEAGERLVFAFRGRRSRPDSR